MREWHYAAHTMYQPVTMDESYVRDRYSLRRVWVQTEFADPRLWHPVLFRSKHRAIWYAIARIEALGAIL